ncbi:hypothetical protein [Bifidobacterium bifidum]|uniref:hypothetical protein n=1 Tax=Bifidobacterium bifidum TaxID=1681 RepID=UPI0012D42DFB|nr:hypothetical protein [Bifidobacterium bifidum]
MKINTDLVKGKKYSSAVKPNTLKHSQEYKVLATLRYLYPSKFDTMITGEAPDLQDSANSTEYLTRWGPGLLRLGAIMSFGGYCVSRPGLLRLGAVVG